MKEAQPCSNVDGESDALAGLAAASLCSARRARWAAPPTAREIVEAADRARNPQQSFRSTLTLVTYRGGQARDRLVMGVHAKI